MEKKKTTKKLTNKTAKKTVKSSVKKVTKSSASKKKSKKKGFTLIELLAVIIILGILMIIAIPSVTSYISDSRKSAYVDTAKEIVSGTRNLVNEGKLGMYDTGTTYYIPAKYVNTENSLKSPYGEFTDESAYVGVIYDGQGYKYYWISSDDTGQGVSNITLADKLDTDDIQSDLKIEDIKTTIENTGIGYRKTIKILKMNGTWDSPIILSNTDNNISEDGAGKVERLPHLCGDHCVCKRAVTLHTTTCNSENNSLGCKDAGYYEGGSKGTSTITYGNVETTPGVLKSGDAFDCKVKENGGFTERFYYLTTNGNNAVLIYYTNVYYGNPNTTSNFPYYNGVNENWHGPVDAIYLLPTTSNWNYVGQNKIIAPTTRAIKTEKNNTSVGGKTLPTAFSYSGYSARLLTTQELERACGVSSFSEKLDNCNYIMENTQYDDVNKIKGYWLENPYDGNTTYACAVICNIKTENVSITNRHSEIGVRPVIDVSIDNIEY